MTDSAALQKLLDSLDQIWRVYRESGPGSVDSALFEGVEPTAARLVDSLSTEHDGDMRLIEAINTSVDLARRCVQRPEGLCFITGEAGLVPRPDLYEKFETALATIRAAVDAGVE